MQIKVRYRAGLAALTKISDESITAGNVKDVLEHVKKQFGREAEKLAKTMLIVVNGHSILMQKHFKTVLKDGDEVSFLPICGGG
ncbi:MAG: MoaD/ThiS family protein [Treponema sp.]|nr:MoaD/ThiS family protein [Treponema sp.]